MAKNLNVNLAFTANASQAKAELNALKKSLNELVSGTALKTPDFQFTKEIQDATKAAAQLKVQLDNAINVKTGNLDLTKFSEQMNKSGMSLEKYQNQLYQLGPAGEKAFADLTRSITMADVPLRRSSKLLDELWTTMKNTARWQLTSSAMHGFMGAISSAYHYAQDLNSSLNEIRIVTGASVDKMAEFAKEANAAAKALSTTTTEYTNASLIFYQQGLTDSQVKERTDITIKMANAAGANAEKVSDQLTAVWNNFYDGSKSLEYYADVMTALGAATASSTDEISQGLQKFAAVADTVGLSYEYATAALATITSNTRESADVVGTALKTLFARIQGLQLGETLEDGVDLNKYSEALDKVGISIYDANGGLKSMDQTLNDMAAKWETLSGTQQVALAQTVAGVRQYTQLIALMENWNNGDNDSMVANLKTAENSTGALQQQADIYAESWEAANKRVQASAEAVYSAILNDEFFIDLTNGFADLVDGVKTFIDSLGGIKGVLLAIGSIVTNVFSKQISQSIQNAAFSIKGFLNPKAILNQEMAQKEKANQLLVSGFKDNDTISGGQSAEAYSQLGIQQMAYIQNSERMSAEEQQINQILMDRNRLLADEAVKAGEKLQKTQEQIAMERKSLEIQARIEAGKNQDKSHGGTKAANGIPKIQKEVEALTKSYSILNVVGAKLDITKDLPKDSEEFKKLKSNIQDVVKELAGVEKLETKEEFKKLGQALGITGDEAKELYTTLSNSDSVAKLQLAVSDLATAAGTGSSVAIDKLRTALINCTGDTDKAEQMMQEYLAVIRQFGPDSVEASEALNKLKTSVGAVSGEMEQAKTKPISMTETFTKATSAIMAVGQAINTVKGIIDVFKDDEATTGDKILAVVSGLGILVPAIMSVVGGLSKVPVAAAGANAALTGTASVAGAAGTAISLSMWQITLIVAAIAAVVAIIIACADAIHKASPEGEFEAASKAAEQAADAASKVQEEYEAVVDTLEGLDSGIEKIHEMERGTLQWRQAIIESNNSLIELLSTYGMLDSKNFTTDADGIMQITDEAREELLNRQSEAVQQVNNANYMAQVNKNNAQMRLDASNTSGGLTLMRSGGDYMYDAVTSNSQLSADIGMAIATAISQGRLDNDDLADSDKLARVLGEVNGLYGQEAEILVKQISSSTELITKFGELGASVTAATEANRILNNQIVEANFGSQIDNSGLDESSREDLTNMMGKNLEQRTEELYEKTYKDKGFLGGGITDEEIQKQYAEAMGWATDTIDNQNGNKAKYYAKDGTEIGVISDEVARRYLAQQKAIEEMGGDVQTYINSLNELIQTGNNIGDGIGEALGTFAGGQQGDLSSLNQKQLDDFKNSVGGVTEDANGNVTQFQIGDLVVDQAYAQKLGYDTVQAYYDAIQAEIAATDEALDVDALADGMGFTQMINGVEKTFNTAGESFKELFALEGLDLNDMTAGGKKAFANAYKTIFEEGGTEALDLVDGVIAQAGENASEIATLIGETNWNDAASADAFIEKLQEMGIEIEGFDAEAFVIEMKDIYDTVNNFTADQFRKEFAEVSEIISGMEIGDVLSAEDYTKLGEGYDEYFTLMADGTYKLTGDAQEFYDVVMKNKRQEMLTSIQDNKDILNESKAQYEAATSSMGSMDSTTIRESQMYSDESGKLWYKGGNVDSQIDFVEQMGGASADQIAAWREELSDGSAPVETLNAITEAAANCGAEYEQMQAQIEANEQVLQNSIQALFTTATSLEDLHAISAQVGTVMGEEGYNTEYYADGLKNLASQYEHCSDEITAYNDALESGSKESIKNAQENLEASVLVGELADKYDLVAEDVEDYAKRLKTMNKDSKMSAEQAVRLATANMRLDRGVSNLNDNLDDYKKALNESNRGSAEWSNTLSDLKTDLADIVNVADGSMLSDTFAEAIVDSEDLKLALDGDVDAILRLRLAAADDIIQNLDIQGDENLDIVQSKWQYLKDNMAAGVTAGTVDQTNLLNAFNEMIAAGNMTKEQIEAALSGLNVSANVHTDYVEQDVEVPTTITQEHMEAGYVPYDYPKADGTGYVRTQAPVYRKYTQTIPGKPVTARGWVPKYSIEGTTDGNGTITSAFAPNPAPKVSSSSTTTGKSGGGGGGGGSTPSAPAKAEKRDTTSKSDVSERYREVTDSIDNVTDALTRAERATDRLWGKDKLDAMRQENKILAEQYKLLQQKAQEAEDYAKQDYNDLMDVADEIGVSVVVDTNTGDITNIEDVEKTLYDRLAAAEAEYNRKVEAYNAAVDAAGDSPTEAKVKELEAMKDAIDAYEKDIIGGIEDDISAWEDAEQTFQDSVETWEDAGLEAEEILDQMMQKNFDIWSESLQLEVEVNDRDLELLDYYLSKTEDNVYQMAEAAALMVGNLNSGFEGGQLGEYLDNLSIYGEKYSELTERLNSTDPEYQITSAQYKEGLEEIQSGLLDNLSSIQELDDAMLNYYGDTLSMVGEEIDKYTEKMEHQTSILEHYANMMDILGKSQDYEAMGTILEGQVKTIQNELDVAEAEYDLYASEAEKKRKLYEEAVANGDAAAAELYKGEWEAAEEAAMEAQSNMLDKTEQWAEAMKAVVENKLQGLAKSLEEALTGGISFDQINTQLERAASLQEEYLTTTNQIYETNKLMRTAQQEVDKTQNTVAKRRLTQFIQETEQLQNQTKLSNYELEIQQAKYDLLLAEIALEEAQNAKSTVRLQRDAEGNFGYVYTADQDKVAQAQQELEDAQNSLYNIGLEGANDYIQKYAETMQEMYDTLAELQQAYLEGEIANEEEYNAKMVAAKQYYFDKLKDYSSLYQVALTTDSRVVNDAWSSDFNDMIYKTSELQNAVNQYTKDSANTLLGWSTTVKAALDQTGLDKVDNQVLSITIESDKLKESLIGKDGKGGVVNAIQAEITEVGNLTGAYALVREQIQGLIGDHELLIGEINQTQKTEEEAAKQANANAENATNNTTTDQQTQNDNAESGNSAAGQYDTRTKAGVALAIIRNATAAGWGNGSTRKKNLEAKGFSYNEIQGLVNTYFDNSQALIAANGINWPSDYSKYIFSRFNTGGYTGSWGSYGKLGILDEKELVLNQGDTANFLASMEVLERILQVIDLHSMNAQLGGLLSSPSYGGNNNETTIEQNVHIEASFPGVSDRNEIEEAFNNLVNQASQYANRK